MSKKSKIISLVAAVFACAAVGLFLIGSYNAPRVTRLDAPVKDLPESLDGLKIVHISDLHFKPPFGLYGEVLQLIRAEQPDIIVITGDLIDDKQYIGQCVEFVGKLKARHGVFTIRGNWEHWAKIDIAAFEKSCREAGANTLVNECVCVDMPGGGLWLVGVDDPYTKHDDLGKALAGIPPGAPMVLLAHSPDIFEEASERKISLVLVGHTHGGQIRLPLIGPLRTANETMRKFDAGLFTRGETRMYVNVGIGTSVIKWRFFCRPEITVITLRRPEK